MQEWKETESRGGGKLDDECMFWRKPSGGEDRGEATSNGIKTKKDSGLVFALKKESLHDHFIKAAVILRNGAVE